MILKTYNLQANEKKFMSAEKKCWSQLSFFLFFLSRFVHKSGAKLYLICSLHTEDKPPKLAWKTAV